MSESPGEGSAAWSAAGGVFVLLGVGAAIPLWLLAGHSDWELALAVSSTVAIGIGLYWMMAALIPLWPFTLARSAEMRYRIDQRRLFARHIQSQLQMLATKEDWRDERFADLEAEVEVEGRQRAIRWLRHSPSKNVPLRREKSLSRALERSAEPLIVLEGDPGAGKSVALRHLAERLADKARRSRQISTIPMYINLKEFRPEHRPVDGQDIYDFILASINRVNDRDVERFLEDEFDRGLRDGSWVILLDSFDEIPDILSSTEADDVVEEYALAIHNFLFGMHKSRAIVASREFRGPKTFRVPRFRIMELSRRRQADLVGRSGLHPNEVRIVEGGLATADPEVRRAATNPMFLGLICEYARTVGRFPENSHSVYESYLAQRFTRDAERVQRRHKVGVSLVRGMAEEIAFSMASVPGLGLSPTRQALRSALTGIDPIRLTKFGAALDALEYTKLGRAVEDADGSGQLSFTFAHRRFQEYFATCVVLRDPDRVSVTQLLADGRWRETAVTILQTQPAAAVAPLLDEAARLLAPMARIALDEEESQAASGGYLWPPGSMHLMGVLSAGLGQTPDSIPDEFRADASSLLMSAWNKGRRHDKKWTVNLALVARKDDMIWLLEKAFAYGSLVLGGAAYACVARQTDPSPGLYKGVRETLVKMAANGDLGEQKGALNAQVRRLADPISLIRTLRLLTLAPNIDLGLAVILVVVCAMLSWPLAITDAVIAMIGLISYQSLLTRTFYGSYRLRGTRLAVNSSFSGQIIMFIGLYCRFGAAIVPALRATTASPRNWPLGVVAIVVGIYFAFWPAYVSFVCTHLKGVSEFLWPVIPLFALAVLLRQAVLNVRTIPAWVLARMLIFLAFFGAFAGALARVMLKYIRVIQPNGKLTEGFIIAISSLYGAALVVAIYVCIAYIYRRRNDKMLIYSVSQAQEPTVRNILGALEQIRTARGLRLLMEWALRIDLIAHPEIIRLLSDLSAAAEAAQAQKKVETAERDKVKAREKDGKALVVPGVTPDFADWLKGHAARGGRATSMRSKSRLPFAVRRMQGPTLDQIARAIEQTEVARGSAPSETLG